MPVQRVGRILAGAFIGKTIFAGKAGLRLVEDSCQSMTLWRSASSSNQTLCGFDCYLSMSRRGRDFDGNRPLPALAPPRMVIDFRELTRCQSKNSTLSRVIGDRKQGFVILPNCGQCHSSFRAYIAATKWFGKVGGHLSMDSDGLARQRPVRTVLELGFSYIRIRWKTGHMCIPWQVQGQVLAGMPVVARSGIGILYLRVA